MRRVIERAVGGVSTASACGRAESSRAHHCHCGMYTLESGSLDLFRGNPAQDSRCQRFRSPAQRSHPVPRESSVSAVLAGGGGVHGRGMTHDDGIAVTAPTPGERARGRVRGRASGGHKGAAGWGPGWTLGQRTRCEEQSAGGPPGTDQVNVCVCESVAIVPVSAEVRSRVNHARPFALAGAQNKNKTSPLAPVPLPGPCACSCRSGRPRLALEAVTVASVRAGARSFPQAEIGEGYAGPECSMLSHPASRLESSLRQAAFPDSRCRVPPRHIRYARESTACGGGIGRQAGQLLRTE